MIDSISEFDFVSSDFYLKFDGEYIPSKQVVFDRVTEIFPSARIVNERLDTFYSWGKAASEIPDDIGFVLLKTNHDHAFVGESIDDFKVFLNDLEALGSRTIGGISHWSEMVGSNDLEESDSRREKSFNFLKKTTWTIGTCVVSKSLFDEWWEEDFTGGLRIIRPDNPFGPSVSFNPCPMLIPPREFFRHLDGYGHVNVRSPFAGPVRSCCHLEGGRVQHIEWKRGNHFIGTHLPDLPLMPLLGQENSYRKYLNLALLASAHTLNFKNLWRLLKPKNGGLGFIKFPLLLLLVTNRYFVIKIPRALLRALGITSAVKRLL
ncbi:MAG: hypothetical protein HY050_03480 [Actinobacteria bacterium]|nr:hypothetical protein [Actinomycetota bacterium]